MRIACLHTSPLGAEIYEGSAPVGVHLTHHIRSDFLYRAGRAEPSALSAEVRSQIARIRTGQDAVLATCSALTPYVETPDHAADRLLARRIEKVGKDLSVEIFFSDPRAEGPVIGTFGALDGPREVKLTEIAGAAEFLANGDRLGHDRLILAAIAKSNADLKVVLQPAAERVVEGKGDVLTQSNVALEVLIGGKQSGA